MDPRLGVAAVGAVILVAMFVLSEVEALAAVLLYLAAWYFAAGGRLLDLLRHLRRAAIFVLIIFILNGLLVPGDAVVSVGDRTVLTLQGLIAGVFYSVRLLVLYMAIIVFIRAVSPEGFARTAHSLLRPFSQKAARSLALGGFLVISFLPLFAREYERVRAAQSFRGAGFKGGLLRRLRSTRLLLVPLVLSAVHRSGQLAAVVEIRDLKTRIGESVSPSKITVGDYFFAALTLAVLYVAAAVINRPAGV